MIYDANYYTALLASISSKTVKIAGTKNQLILLVGGNMIFGDVDDNPDEFNKDKFEAGDSLLFTSAKKVIDKREHKIETNLSESEQDKIEPVYLYLRNVTIRSTSSATNTQISELAVRVSSIDGISIGMVPE